jgi:hypothetical protein
MAKLILNGATSGSISLESPAVSGTTTLTLPTSSGTITVAGVNSNIVASTAVASTSGTSIDFTGIPSWVKRITVMFNNVSTNGSSYIQVRIGDGSIVATGYVGYYSYATNAGAVSASSVTTGFQLQSANAANNIYGTVILNNVSGNTWVANVSGGAPAAFVTLQGGGGITLSGVLDRVRITTVNGTDTFDAGSINILYE